MPILIVKEDFTCQGKLSIAFQLWFAKEDKIDEWCNTVNKLPQSFQFIYIILIGNISDAILLNIQQKLIRGQIRLYPAKDIHQCYQFMNECIKQLMDISKLDVQKEYFKAEMNRIESLLSVQDILYEALNRMDIHEQDIQIIFENINSFEELLQIGSEKIDNLPNYLSAIQPFFSSST